MPPKSLPASSSAAAPPAPQGSPPPQRFTVETILGEFGDSYTGEVSMHPSAMTKVAHGQGTLESRSGNHRYAGAFHYSLREGYGRQDTGRWTLRCKWAQNRPDVTSAVRVDYPNKDAYIGYVELVATDPKAFQLKGVSKFSQWVAATTPIRKGWGEMVSGADGGRYFGMWLDNERHGFGCWLRGPLNFVSSASPAALAATAANALHGPPSSAPGGEERHVGMYVRGYLHGAGVSFPSSGSAVDGHWVKGVLTGPAEVTFPGGVRLNAEWHDALNFVRGEISLPDRSAAARKWTPTSMFEPLLSGASDGAKRQAQTESEPMKRALTQATTTSDVERAVEALFARVQLLSSCLKMARRMFYFFYGSCGDSAHRGSGQKNNPLGWCTQRKQCGGCIHLSRGGEPYTDATLTAALSDIHSFVLSCRHFALSLVGDQAAEVVRNLEADIVVSRKVLDLLLPGIHDLILNVFLQAHLPKHHDVSRALKRLKGVSLDDVGANFGRYDAEERLFEPYTDAIHTLKGFCEAPTLTGKLDLLRRWSHDIDISTRMSQVRLHEDALVRVANVKRQDLTAAASFVAPNSMMDAAATASRYPSSSANLISEDDHVGGAGSPPAAGPPPSDMSRAFNVEVGSADDLLPIHQYTVIAAQLPVLSAHTELVAAFADEDYLVDHTSQDCFCVTTLHACVSILPELYPEIRDTSNVVTPPSVLAKRLDDIVQGSSGWAEDRLLRDEVIRRAVRILDHYVALRQGGTAAAEGAAAFSSASCTTSSSSSSSDVDEDEPSSSKASAAALPVVAPGLNDVVVWGHPLRDALLLPHPFATVNGSYGGHGGGSGSSGRHAEGDFCCGDVLDRVGWSEGEFWGCVEDDDDVDDGEQNAGDGGGRHRRRTRLRAASAVWIIPSTSAKPSVSSTAPQIVTPKRRDDSAAAGGGLPPLSPPAQHLRAHGGAAGGSSPSYSPTNPALVAAQQQQQQIGLVIMGGVDHLLRCAGFHTRVLVIGSPVEDRVTALSTHRGLQPWRRCSELTLIRRLLGVVGHQSPPEPAAVPWQEMTVGEYSAWLHRIAKGGHRAEPPPRHQGQAHEHSMISHHHHHDPSAAAGSADEGEAAPMHFAALWVLMPPPHVPVESAGGKPKPRRGAPVVVGHELPPKRRRSARDVALVEGGAGGGNVSATSAAVEDASRPKASSNSSSQWLDVDAAVTFLLEQLER